MRISTRKRNCRLKNLHREFHRCEAESKNHTCITSACTCCRSWLISKRVACVSANDWEGILVSLFRVTPTLTTRTLISSCLSNEANSFGGKFIRFTFTAENVASGTALPARMLEAEQSCVNSHIRSTFVYSVRVARADSRKKRDPRGEFPPGKRPMSVRIVAPLQRRQLSCRMEMNTAMYRSEHGRRNE